MPRSKVVAFAWGMVAGALIAAATAFAAEWW